MNMIEVKTAELSGAALDWAVAVAVGESSPRGGLGGGGCVVAHGHTLHRYCPSTEWSHGGPLIAKHLITVGTEASTEDGSVYFWAYTEAAYAGMPVVFGETHLIAACRAIVAANLGDTVKVPAELLP